METVTVKGKVYQIGVLYTSMCGCHIGHLKEVTEESFILDCGIYIDLQEIGAINASELGTITDAPLELEDGEWYMCKYQIQTASETFSWANEVLLYDGRFVTGDDWAHLKPLYKMVREHT